MGRFILALVLLICVGYGQSRSPGEAIRIGPGVTPPKPTKRPEPTYSDEARAAGIQGSVLFELVVNEQGMPADTRLISPLGFGLDERAQATIEKWRFQPGMKNGKPVKILANIEVNFRLLGASFNAKDEERRTQYNLALRNLQLDAKQKERGIKTMEELVQKKFPAAMFAYGELLANGKELPPDPPRSRDLIAQAAQAKYGPAMFAVALTSIEQKPSPPDLEKYKDMIRSAAILGSVDAQYFLGGVYEKGNPDLGYQKDDERARQHYRQCAATGHMECQFKLGELLLNRPDRSERDLIQGSAWLELAADQGLAPAKALVEQLRSALTSEQTKDVQRLKQLLVHRA